MLASCHDLTRQDAERFAWCDYTRFGTPSDWRTYKGRERAAVMQESQHALDYLLKPFKAK